MDVQQRDRIGARRRGYVAASVGTLVGGVVGAGVGRFVGLPLAERVAGDVKGSGDAEGVEAVVEGVGVGLGKVIVTVLVLFMAVVMITWLGAVLGAGLALRVSGNDRAARTALLTGLVGPVVVVSSAAVANALVGAIRGGTAYLVYGVAAVIAALAGRWLALLGPGRRRPALGFAEFPTDK